MTLCTKYRATIPAVLIRLAIGVQVALFAVTACSGCGPGRQTAKEEKMPQLTIEQVLEKHTDQWMAMTGVVGTGIGQSGGKPCIKVFVIKTTDELSKKIPTTVDGYPVLIEETGEFKALDKE
jgi:hypothetical protein